VTCELAFANTLPALAAADAIRRFVAHGDRSYTVFVNGTVPGNADGALAERLVLALNEHLPTLGLADGAAPDIAVNLQVPSIGDQRFAVATMLPEQIAFDGKTFEHISDGRLDLPALDWQTAPNVFTRTYAQNGYVVEVVADINEAEFASRYTLADATTAFDSWAVTDLFTVSPPFEGPTGQEMPGTTSVITQRTKWFGGFGVVVRDSFSIPAEDDPTFLGGSNPDGVLVELDAWFAIDRVPAVMKRSVTAPERIALTRLCNAIDVEEIDRFASSKGGPTLDAAFSRRRTSGLIEATASAPTGVLATCATRLVLANTPDGATPRLDVQAFEFEDRGGFSCVADRNRRRAGPTTTPVGLSAYFVPGVRPASRPWPSTGGSGSWRRTASPAR